MKMILILALSFLTEIAAAKDYHGFLLNNELVVMTFESDIKSKVQNFSSDAIDITQNRKAFAYFDGKSVANILMIDRMGTCYKKLTAEEIKEKAPPQEAPCFDLANQDLTRNYSADPLVKVKIPDKKIDKINKLAQTKSFKFEWGFLNEHVKSRPLFVSTNQELQDPQAWAPISFKRIPQEIQLKIKNEALKHRSPQKCTEENSKISEYKLNSKNLETDGWFVNKNQTVFAGSVKIVNIDDLATCNGNELGIPSAFIVFKSGKAQDILAKQDWNYRDLAVIEALDLNKDGTSELIFVDNAYNRDGFSILDLKSMQLTTFADSSH